jgi:hypothetical protein
LGQEGVGDVVIWVVVQVDLAEYSKGGKLRSHTQPLLTEPVETGSEALPVCFIILYLIALVVYKWQPQKKSY